MAKKGYIETITEGTTKFLTKYIEDSAYFVNRFMVGYNKNKLRRLYYSYGMDKEQVEKVVLEQKSYQKIDREFVWNLYLFYEAMEKQIPTEKDMVVYRGCDTLEDHAMDGINATSRSRKIAENFNYGTLLKINVPAGSKVIVCSEFVEDLEEQIVLPPCDYTIVNEHNEMTDGRDTRVVEINIKPRDILTDFSLAMHRPTQDYIKENGLGDTYIEAFNYLVMIMVRRALNVYPDELLEKAIANKDNPNYGETMKGKESFADISIIEFLISTKDQPKMVVKHALRQKFYYVSPEELDLIYTLVRRFNDSIRSDFGKQFKY